MEKKHLRHMDGDNGGLAPMGAALTRNGNTIFNGLTRIKTELQKLK